MATNEDAAGGCRTRWNEYVEFNFCLSVQDVDKCPRQC